MIQKGKFLIFCMIFVAGGVFGQNSATNLTYKSNFTSYKNVNSKIVFGKLCTPSQKKTTLNIANVKEVSAIKITLIPSNYYTQNFGFFCKKELQLQKAIKVPFVFRLGSVEMCDRMEGKRR